MGKLKNKIFYILPLTIFFSAVSCDTNEPPTNSNILLKLEDVSCTEAWIEIATTNLTLPTTVTLKQTNPNGDTKSQILNLNTKDSLLYIDSLLPNQTYKFKSVIQSINQSSNELSITTMEQLDDALSVQKNAAGQKLGRVLVDLGYASQQEVDQAYADQLGFPYLDLDHLPHSIKRWPKLSRRALSAATRPFLFPLCVRSGGSATRQLCQRGYFASPYSLRFVFLHFYSYKLQRQAICRLRRKPHCGSSRN